MSRIYTTFFHKIHKLFYARHKINSPGRENCGIHLFAKTQDIHIYIYMQIFLPVKSVYFFTKLIHG